MEAALADYNRALQLDPEYALAYYGRALVHEALGNQEQAFADYDQAIQLEPGLSAAIDGSTHSSAITWSWPRDHVVERSDT